MKKTLSILICLVLAFALVSCGGGSEPASNFSLDTTSLINDLHAANLFIDSLSPISENALTKVVGVSTDGVTDFTYEMGTGVTGEELCVITCDSEATAKRVLDEVTAHREDYMKQYESYAPDALPRMENAVLEQKGVYVIYVSAEDDATAQSIVDGYLK
ncbi:MAG: DUF4358 domain-containing protein [Oscillospiraceae bacterium]|nr:DUF4358 domain-containing protein [Oscillospiraceae bacterium]